MKQGILFSILVLCAAVGNAQQVSTNEYNIRAKKEEVEISKWSKHDEKPYQWYMKLGITKGFEAGMSYYKEVKNYTLTDTQYQNRYLNGGMGKGTVYGVELGRWINPHIALQWGVSVAKGRSPQTNSRYMYPYSMDGKTYYPINDVTRYERGVSVRTGPSLLLSTNAYKKCHMYTRVSVFLATSSTKTYIDEVYEWKKYGFNDGAGQFEWKNKQKSSIGMLGALGGVLSFPETTFKLFAEVYFLSQSNKMESSKRTKYIVNESNLLNTLTVQQKEIVYQDEYDSGLNQSKYEPKKEPVYSISYNQIGVQIGMMAAF